VLDFIGRILVKINSKPTRNRWNKEPSASSQKFWEQDQTELKLKSIDDKTLEYQ
jgi:hypothetical protein